MQDPFWFTAGQCTDIQKMAIDNLKLPPKKELIMTEKSIHQIKSWATELEEMAQTQINNVASLPFIYKHVAVMPDAHPGFGSTVGTVIATKGAIIPSAIGVDIGCGMQAIKLPFKVDIFGDSLSLLRDMIESVVPVGFNWNKTLTAGVRDFRIDISPRLLPYIYSEKHALQLGSLGGGNHFIEICQDQHNDLWIMLHSGSRSIGKECADIHINNAKGLMKQYFIELPDPDLAYLACETKEFSDYINDLIFCQAYARENRNEMMSRILQQTAKFINKTNFTCVEFIDCHHNYTCLENHFGQDVWITRKGAVSAKEGQLGIIPGSMGTKSYIVRGKGNRDSFNSCSHGAGRIMSRKKAREIFTLQDFNKQTEGVECRKDESLLDEIPGAYKDIDQVMANQTDLVDIVYVLKQLICIKG